MNRYLIKELEYAKSCHRESARLEREIIKQKNFVISALKKKAPSRKDIKKSIQYVRLWKESHIIWIEIVRLNRKWAKIGGSIRWQKRWIKTYDEIVIQLKQKNNRSLRGS